MRFLQKVSYFNLGLAVVYTISYIRGSTINFALGILSIIVFNWLALVSFDKENYNWRFWHFLIGAYTLYYVGTLAYGLVGMVSASIEFNFITNSNLIYVGTTALLCLAVVSQMSLYFLVFRKDSKP